MPHLLCLGFGFTARALTGALGPGWRVTGTTRHAAGLDAVRAAGAEPLLWPGEELTPALAQATHVLSSVPPRDAGDPAQALMAAHLGRMPRLEWLGLLSTTGVYGDHGGGWVDEDTPLVPATHRGGLRAAQNAAWMDLWRQHGLPVHIFRLAGIYGPGRSAFDKLRDGSARRIVKPGQVFSRIHVDDIVQVLRASFARPHPGRAYNVADDAPGPPQDVIEHAARLLGVPVPPDQPFDQAELTPMARSFYADNKRVRNDRIKNELEVRLKYPDYRAGLAAVLSAHG
ncbi:SDR family NAD(P)-dependent oxidoreductase [Rhodobacteraceae bacterium 2CG4]|uniref:SDR family NAD(P)-dependent oxidoreductase n=1 Tax=Halovulum marinum TaxID=2662447 RepID=A0A6L5Z2E6_9RHOB|nr:SDR family oxidoreductase [Halovulum marinum]MSU90698.1 SDR family NAD(P)-dependent oxidoreductase [Halovulum marinum]